MSSRPSTARRRSVAISSASRPSARPGRPSPAGAASPAAPHRAGGCRRWTPSHRRRSPPSPPHRASLARARSPTPAACWSWGNVPRRCRCGQRGAIRRLHAVRMPHIVAGPAERFDDRPAARRTSRAKMQSPIVSARCVCRRTPHAGQRGALAHQVAGDAERRAGASATCTMPKRPRWWYVSMTRAVLQDRRLFLDAAIRRQAAFERSRPGSSRPRLA